MSEPDDRTAAPAFALQVGYDQDELLGARWWQDSIAMRAVAASARAVGPGATADESRRAALKALILLGGGTLLAATVMSSTCSGPRTISVLRDSIDLQREQGLATGEAASFAWPHMAATACDGSSLDRDRLGDLARELMPEDGSWQPLAVPTLFQVFANDQNRQFTQQFAMVHSPAMQAAFAQGEAIGELLAAAQQLRRWALVIDLPGPEAVAFAAGLQPRATAVFTFDNWPHPRGIVPAHLTLAAAVYYRPRFRPDARRRDAPPAFVLDRNRLAAYADDPTRFDNRYTARLPQAPYLVERGVQHVLYVVPGASDGELDDLNERFVTWRTAGIEIHLLSLGDVVPATPDPAAPNPTAPNPTANATPRYYWHGTPGYHWWFWNHYGWSSAASPVPAVRPPMLTSPPTLPLTRRQTMFDGIARLGKTQQRQTDYGSSGSTSRGGSWSRSSGGFGG